MVPGKGTSDGDDDIDAVLSRPSRRRGKGQDDMVSDRDDADRPLSAAPPTPDRGGARTVTPPGRVGPDWWHTPSIAPTATVRVEGTDEFQSALDQVANDWPSRNVTAQLLADPADPTDRHAVVVLLDGYEVGRLGPDRDPRFPAIVKHLTRTQGTVRVRARLVDLPAADRPSRRRGLDLFAHPECFDPARHFLAGDRLVDVRPGLDALALVADLPEHAPFGVELVPAGERIGVRLHAAPHGAARRPDLDIVPTAVDPLLGTLALDVSASLLPVLQSAANREITASCLASWSADVTGRPIIRLHLIDRPELLDDVCGPPPREEIDQVG
jgi:hypothetical protein